MKKKSSNMVQPIFTYSPTATHPPTNQSIVISIKLIIQLKLDLMSSVLYYY